MKAVEANLLEFLKKSPQFVIPIYQRTYSWTQQECQQLWDDIVRTGLDDKVKAHFVGSIVYVEKGLYSVSSQSPLLVIDGQQRLTTVMLLIEAISRVLGDSEPIDGFTPKKLRSYYLLNPLEDGERRYKLILSQTDKASLIALFDQLPRPDSYSFRIDENFAFFSERLAEAKDDMVAVCKGLAKLIIVDISLNREQDNPQLIFESMNSTGRELTQADLIRNFILMGLEPALQTKLYEQYWRPMEVDFGQEGYVDHFDGFMRHYLTFKSGEIPNVREVYDAFKQYTRSLKAGDTESLVSDLRTFARYYCAMALGAEKDPDLKAVFRDLAELKVDVAYPLLLEAYHDYATGTLQHDDMLRIVRLIESYVFRRAVCSLPTNSMNKTFSTFGRSLKKDRYLESVQAAFLLLPSYRRFPDDAEFQRELPIRDLYNNPRLGYWLRRLENHDRKEHVPVSEYTIEHIMPQREQLSPKWKEELGPEWERVHETWLHTPGNLTLTGYNSEYGYRPFIEKRDMTGGFKESPLRVNQGLAKLDHWNEQTIRDRAAQIAEKSTQVWIAPLINADVLSSYKPEVKSTGYTIDHYGQLAPGPLRDLFEEFRKGVLALNPCVTEEFRKLYVAYKAETNFVDATPQAKRLRLALNLRFHEIVDPKGMCRDVTNVGRWGNGDVEVILSSPDQLPYVMGLVRQSFEHQMGEAAKD